MPLLTSAIQNHDAPPAVLRGHVPVGDLDVHYELADYTPPWHATPAPVVLLHHGYARNLNFWQQWVPRLAADFRVLRFDARGCGGTTRTPPGERYNLDQFVADAIGLLDVLGIDQVHWVGESSGGIVGLTAALDHTARLHSLTLCDTPFKRPETITRIYTLGEEDRLAAFRKHGVEGWCRQTLGYRLDLSRATPAMQDWYCRELGRTPPEIAAALEQMIGRGNLWPRLPEVRTPTLILAGENSPIATAEAMAAMQERLPHALWQRFAGYGHGVHLLAPDQCVARWRDFVGPPAIAG